MVVYGKNRFFFTMYVIKIGQFERWLKMWLKEVLTLKNLGNNQGVKMASNISLYLESSFSNMLFQKVFSRSINLPNFGTCTMKQTP